MDKYYWPPRRNPRSGHPITKIEAQVMQHLRDNYDFKITESNRGKVDGVWVHKQTKKTYKHIDIYTRLESGWL